MATLSAHGQGRPGQRRSGGGHENASLTAIDLVRARRLQRSSGIAPELDFIAVHLYPEKGKVKEAMEMLSGFAMGKPVVIEEMFPLRCSLAEFEEFLDQSRNSASGWIGFYWGKTPLECRQSNTIQDALMLGWLEIFQKRVGEVQKTETPRP
jgi:hypothetical protein